MSSLLIILLSPKQFQKKKKLELASDNEDSDDIDIQPEDTYADIGDGLVLETEENKSTAGFRSSLDFWEAN